MKNTTSEPPAKRPNLHPRVVGINGFGEITFRDTGWLQSQFKVLDNYLSNELDHIEGAFVMDVLELQEVNSPFARVSGYCIDGKCFIELGIEFCALDENTKAWASIKSFAHGFAGTIKLMDKRPHLDRHKSYDCPDWVEGPDHGKPETHVEMVWDVTHMNKSQIAEKIAVLKHSMSEELWWKYGMSVS